MKKKIVIGFILIILVAILFIFWNMYTAVDTDIKKCEYSDFGDYSIFPKDVRKQFSLVDGTGILDKEINTISNQNISLPINVQN